jgi:hypothetical protein
MRTSDKRRLFLHNANLIYLMIITLLAPPPPPGRGRLVIGAHKSDTVVVVRTRPVIRLIQGRNAWTSQTGMNKLSQVGMDRLSKVEMDRLSQVGMK